MLWAASVMCSTAVCRVPIDGLPGKPIGCGLMMRRLTVLPPSAPRSLSSGIMKLVVTSPAAKPTVMLVEV